MNEAAEEESYRRKIEAITDDLELLIPLLNDPDVTDIHVLTSGKVKYTSFLDGKHTADIVLSVQHRTRIILSMASMLGYTIDLNARPVVESIVPNWNARFTGILPPRTQNPTFTIRKPPKKIYTLEDYLEKGRISKANYETVCDYIKRRQNILIGGSPGSGKTTFLNAVIFKMTEFTPMDRFYIVEDVPEIQCNAEDTTIVQADPRDAADMVRLALRWTPERVLFGELRYGSVADEYLKLLNAGASGSATTIHANSCSSMILRMESLLKECITGVLPDVNSLIHLLVHLTNKGDGPVIDEVCATKYFNLSSLSKLHES